MMQVLVSDYTVYADLVQTDLVDPMFRIPDVDFAAVDLLLAREFTAVERARLGRNGLVEVTLSDQEILAARDYQRSAPCISLTEAGSLVAAKRRQMTVFAGHGHLRYCAEADGVTSVDVLWVLDRLELFRVVESVRLRGCLETLWAHPRCRLPQDEVKERMSRWVPVKTPRPLRSFGALVNEAPKKS